jgi:glycosyltransferase involved in cell wall biosynthesis
MKILFDTSMLYIDYHAKRGVYYFTADLLKHLMRSGKVDIIRYPLTRTAGLGDFGKIILNVVKAVKRLDVDLLFIPHPRTFTHVATLFVIPRPINVVIHDVHFLVTPSRLGYKLKLVPRYLLVRGASRLRNDVIITTVSNFSKYAIHYWLGIENSKIFVIYPGIDELFKPIDRDYAKHYIREKYGIQGEFFTYIGAISERKGVNDIFRAFLLSRRRGLRQSLVIAGPVESKQLLEYMRGLDFVKYLGHVPREDLPFLLTASTAFLFLGYHEGFGLPPLEAMACGTPVIVSRIPVFLETIGDAGLFVNPGDYEGIANAMLRLATDEKLRDELSERALNRASRFTWRKTTEDYINLWVRLAK